MIKWLDRLRTHLMCWSVIDQEHIVLDECCVTPKFGDNLELYNIRLTIVIIRT